MTKKNFGPGRYARIANAAGRSLATLSALTVAVGAALAQDAEPARVIVTGSYIPTAESEGPLPVSIYTAAQLQRAGANTPAEGLRQLPSFVGATATENDSNGGTGAAFINLRALGAGNTLVLFNGRRAFGFTDVNAIGIGMINRSEILKDGASSVYGSDAVAGVVNFIMLNGPGADKFRGVEIDLLYGNTTNKDAGVKQAYLNAGWGNDRMNIVFSATYYDRQAIYSRDRHLSGQADQRPFGGRNGESPTYPGRIDLNGTNPTIIAALPPVAGLPASVSRFNRTLPLDQNDAGRVTGLASTRIFNQAQLGDGFNFRAFTPAVPAQEKFSYYGAFDYKLLGDNRAVIYGAAYYSNTRQDNGLAPAPFSLTSGSVRPLGGVFPLVAVRDANGVVIVPSAAGTGGDGVNLSPFNPFPTNITTPLTSPSNAAASNTIRPQLTRVRYRLVQESGNRRSGYDHKFYRFEAGLKGDFTFKGNSVLGSFNYDFGAVYEEDKLVRTDTGDAKRSGIVAQILPPGALSEAILTRQATANGFSAGQLAEAIALNRQFGGTFNPFIGTGAPSTGTVGTFDPGTGLANGTRAYDNAAAALRASYNGNSININKQYLVDARFGGVLFPNLPQGGIPFSFGAEYRQERTSDEADPTQRQGDQLGFNAGADDSYHRSIYSGFGEIVLPIVTPSMKVPGILALEFSAAGRYEKFDVFEGATSVINGGPLEGRKVSFNNGFTPRITFRYQPFDQLTLRGSWGQSFASPGYVSLFSPITQNFPQINDPLRGQILQPADGVYQGGNAALKPEQTDSYTLGLVYTPKWFKGFTMTVDYYQLNTTSLILTPTSAAQLFATVNGNSGGTLLALTDPNDVTTPGVRRDPVTRELLQINAPYSNSGKRLVEGLDVVFNYELPTSNFGKFTWTLGWNHFFRWKAEAVPGLGSTNFRGGNFLGLPLAPGALPNNKGYFRTEWELGGFYLTGTVNYIGDYHNDGSFLDGSVQIGGTDANPVYSKVRNSREYITLDLQASYEFKKPKSVEAGFSKDSKGVRTQVASQAVGGNFFQRALWGTKIKVGVNNVFDTPPPYDASAFNDNYDTSTYSIRNRYYYIGINKKF